MALTTATLIHADRTAGRLARDTVARIHGEMTAQAVTHADLAATLGIKERRVRRLLHADPDTNLTVIALLAAALGLDVQITLVPAT